jgi:hypothetical protein
MITVVNKYKYFGPAISIMRPSLLGNPYKLDPLKKGADRQDIIIKYKFYFKEISTNTPGPICKALNINEEKCEAIYNELMLLKKLAKEMDLAISCCCSPKICHGNVVKEWCDSEDEL